MTSEQYKALQARLSTIQAFLKIDEKRLQLKEEEEERAALARKKAKEEAASAIKR